MNTGTAIQGRPSMGSWIRSGLGGDCADLPGFVVMTSDTPGGRSPQPISTRQWHSGFLRGQYQGIEFHAGGDPVYYLNRPPGVSQTRQRDVLDAVVALNRLREQAVHHPEIEARIRQRERTPAATTTCGPSPSGWPVAESRAGPLTAPPTSSATTPSRTLSTSTTSMPPSSTCSASTTMRLTYRYQGRDFRLTDVQGWVVQEILA
jgi:hypothetical protein